MPTIAIVSSSLRRDSNSRVLAQEAERILLCDGHRVLLLDLREYPLPLCDAGEAYSAASVRKITELLCQADAVLIATPIYNYDATAAVKNLIELTGDAWENKVVGFLCAAGGMSSYMSIMALANSLMLDFRSFIVPRFVYATADAFGDGTITDPEIRRRTEELALLAGRLAGAIRLAA